MSTTREKQVTHENIHKLEDDVQARTSLKGGDSVEHMFQYTNDSVTGELKQT